MAFDFTLWGFVFTVIGSTAAVVAIVPQLRKMAFGWLRRKPGPILPLDPANRHIVGRDKDIQRLHKALKSKHRVAIVKGMGGVGKTTLARLYSQRHEHRYKGIAWLNAENTSTLVEDISRYAKKWHCDPEGETPEARAIQIVSHVPKGWLLVYDNAPRDMDAPEGDEKGIRNFLPPLGIVDVLVTSRFKNWSSGFETLEPEVLETKTVHSDGVKLLIQEAAPKSLREEVARKSPDPDMQLIALVKQVEREGHADDAVSLAERLGGLPLGLVITGALVREEGGTFAEWEHRLDEVLGAAEQDDYGKTITAAVGLSYDKLTDKARTLIDLMAWMAPEGLEARLFTDVPGSNVFEALASDLGEELVGLCKDPGAVRAALRELESRSLIGRSGAGYDMHRLTADALRARQGDQRAARAGAAAAVLAASYPHVYSSTYSECTRLTPHVLAFRRAVGADAPALAAVDYLYNQCAIYLREIAQRDAALDLAREALRLTEARLGEADYDVAIGHSMLGLALMEAGELSAAVATLRKAVKLREDHNHGAAALARGLNNLAEALSAQGRATGDRGLLEEALQTTERALPLRKEALGESHPEVAATLSNLAAHHDALGNRAAAIDFARQALDMCRDELESPQDGRLGFALNNLGGLLLKDGQAGAAVPFLTEALQIFEANFAHLDDVHPRVIDTARWLATAHLVAGDTQAARALADRFGLDWEMHLAHAAQLSQTESPEPG